MKIKADKKFFRGLGKGGETVNSFNIVKECCNRFVKEYDKDWLIFLLTNTKVSFGAPYEYLMDDVKFCPFCGEEIEIEDQSL